MTVKTRIIAAFLAVLMLLPLCACEKEYPESEDDNKLALAGYLEFFEVPGDVEIKELEKYVFAKETVYRVLRSKYRSYEPDEMEFLIIFDRDTKTTRTAFFADMEKGLQREDMLLWESRETKAKSSHVFSEKEIADLIAQVAEHIEKARHPGSALPNTGA